MTMALFKSGVFLGLSTVGVVLSAALPLPAQAFNLLPTTISGNECSGSNFQDCQINGDSTLIKFTGLLNSVDEVNGLFSSIDGSEFTFLNLQLNDDDEIISGDWIYNPNDATDPVITSWAVKAGNAYNLYTNDGPIFSGSFVTPRGAGLSHLTFLGQAGSGETSVPEPSAILGLGAIAGLVFGLKLRLETTV